MRLSPIGKAAGIALGLLTTTALPAAASAASYAITSTTIDPTRGGLSGTINYSVSGYAYAASSNIGRLALSTAAGPSQTTFRSYCVDIFDALSPATFTEKGYTAGNLASAISQRTFTFSDLQLQRLETFIERADAIVGGAGGTATQSAAAQLGVWEILFEGGSNGYDVRTGQFSASGSGLGDATTLANTWLGYLTTSDTATRWTNVAGSTIGLLDGGRGNQQQAYVIRTTGGNVPGAVPEPASWAMMLAGFGAVGAMIRRRRQGLAVA